MTLTRYISKVKTQNGNDHDLPTMGYKTPRQIFSAEQEESLKKYLLQDFKLISAVI